MDAIKGSHANSFVESSMVHKWHEITDDAKEFLIRKEIIFQRELTELNKDEEDELSEKNLLNFFDHRWNEEIFNNNEATNSDQNIETTVSDFDSDACLNHFCLKNLFHDFEWITSEILEKLCDEKIFVNIQNLEEFDNYIDRMFKQRYMTDTGEIAGVVEVNGEIYDFSDESEYSLAQFIKKAHKSLDYERVYIISDIGGSGKTTALKKIQETFVNFYQSYWVCFVSFRDHFDDFYNFGGGSFEEFMIKLQGFNDLEVEIFHKKYQRNEVKFLFDGFDEIAPECTENVLKILRLFKEENLNQVFITTRPLFEISLESELDTLSYQLKEFDFIIMKDYLLMTWKGALNPDSLLILISHFIARIFDLLKEEGFEAIGAPLLLNALGEIFKGKIDENTHDEIDKLTLYDVFNRIAIKASLKIYKAKFPEHDLDAEDNNENILTVHQYFAVVYLFDDEFDCEYDPDEWSPDDLAKGGILRTIKGSKEATFNHTVYVEYFVAFNAFFRLKRKDKSFDLILRVLKEEKFKLSRMFMNAMICEKILNSSPLKVREKRFKFENFKGRKNFVEALKVCDGKEEILKQLFDENRESILTFLLFCAYESDHEIYQNLIENSFKFLPKVKDSKAFEKALDEAFEFYGENVEEFLKNFLVKAFDEMLTLTATDETLKVLVEKLRNNVEISVVTKIFLHTEESLFLFAWQKGEHLFISYYTKVFFELYDVKEIMSITDSLGTNVLHCVTGYGIDGLQSLINTLRTKLKKGDMKEILLRKTKYGANILHLAGHTQMDYNVRFDLKLSVVDFCEKNRLLVFETFCEFIKLKDFIYDKFGDHEQNFFHIFIFRGSKELVKFVIEKLKEKLEPDVFISFLKISTKYDQNIFHIVCTYRGLEFMKFFFKTIKDELKVEELQELLMQVDDEGKNPLYSSFKSCSVKELACVVAFYEQTFGSIKEFLEPSLVMKYANINKTKEIVKYAEEILKTFDINYE